MTKHNHSIPQYVGPGIWHTIHKEAWQPPEIFIPYMNRVCKDFPCSVCGNHCKEYMASHPITAKYLNMTDKETGRRIGLFYWTWEFHNEVNQRTNKEIMDWDTAYNMYAPVIIPVCHKSN